MSIISSANKTGTLNRAFLILMYIHTSAVLSYHHELCSIAFRIPAISVSKVCKCVSVCVCVCVGVRECVHMRMRMSVCVFLALNMSSQEHSNFIV